MSYPWMRADGRLRHLITLENIPTDVIQRLLDGALEALPHAHRGSAWRGQLRGSALATLFFEPSTRTRSSFQLAATRLGMDILNFDVAMSSSGKGESDRDTLNTLAAMGVQAFAIRHGRDGAVAELTASANTDTVLINAGDGRSNHPTQGLLDMLTLRQALGADLTQRCVLICGDVLHSRVARSDLHALRALGAGEIRVCGPDNLLPEDDTLAGCQVYGDFDAAVRDADAIIMLRLQRERMSQGLVSSLDDYFRDFGLTPARLAKAGTGAVVLHPGPMNRGIEIDSRVADGPQSHVLRQVANGVAVRMAVLRELLAA